jgi:16S rRNA (uracil1498-N3)-methyltransferase
VGRHHCLIVTRRRFHAPPDAFAPDGASLTLSVEETRHLRDVLRLGAGEEVSVFDGEGREFACVVIETGARGRDARARLEVRGPAEPPSPESPLELTLALALLKGEKFELVVKKATELGVSRLIPVATRRADVRLRDDREAAARLERWHRLAVEAAKQSGRARVPEAAPPVAFDRLVAQEERGDQTRLMFAERGGRGFDESLDELTSGVASLPSRAVALVGPEGGWDDEEIAQAAAHGWRIVTLGGRILRAETAALVVAALLQHRLGDLR